MFVLFCITALLCAINYAHANMDGGPGLWFVHGINNCDEELPRVAANITVNKHKLNRTHDVYDAALDVYETVGDGYGILIDICKHTDGGCKQVQVVTDNDIGMFAEKYAKDNMEVAFSMGGIDPPRFPVQPGSYKIEDFYFDHCEMPEESIYGEFTGDAFIVKDNVRVACFRAHVEFREEEDNICNRG
ncbi:unnamed protein product [Pieris macdunnoughi]|uniref:Uncharacterized protein n=1 Tax=Pieris macdunnoughi TaxID=345717 RepID=A0A821M9Y5_9NEOP|nr:unnamed protein product [Pieris macdunnoughi]